MLWFITGILGMLVVNCFHLLLLDGGYIGLPSATKLYVLGFRTK